MSNSKRKWIFRKIGKVLKTIILVVLGIIAAAIIALIVIRGFNKARHKVKSNAGANIGTYLNIGGLSQYIHMRSENLDNPVIIYLHGGPGSPDSYVTYLFADRLDEEYTVITWDQRGAGRTYEANYAIDPNNNSARYETALSDLDELVDFVRDMFKQDKVIIMGHSYGSLLGINYAYLHPDKVSHFIGIGQVVCPKEGEQRSYEDAMKKATELGDDTREMEAAWAEYEKNTSNVKNMLAVRTFTSKYHKAPKGANEIWTGITSPDMKYKDVRYFLRLLDENFVYTKQSELFRSIFVDMREITDYEVPIDIIQGEYDWVCPSIMAKEYYEMINAPSKGYYEIVGCGHGPQYDDPEAFAKVVYQILGN